MFKIIIILIVISILLCFISNILLNKAEEIYNKYHIKKLHRENNNNIYSSMQFYDEPHANWTDIENTYNLLIYIGLLFKKISPFILFISIIIFSIYLVLREKNKPTS